MVPSKSQLFLKLIRYLKHYTKCLDPLSLPIHPGLWNWTENGTTTYKSPGLRLYGITLTSIPQDFTELLGLKWVWVIGHCLHYRVQVSWFAAWLGRWKGSRSKWQYRGGLSYPSPTTLRAASPRLAWPYSVQVAGPLLHSPLWPRGQLLRLWRCQLLATSQFFADTPQITWYSATLSIQNDLITSFQLTENRHISLLDRFPSEFWINDHWS